MTKAAQGPHPGSGHVNLVLWIQSPILITVLTCLFSSFLIWSVRCQCFLIVIWIFLIPSWSWTHFQCWQTMWIFLSICPLPVPVFCSFFYEVVNIFLTDLQEFLCIWRKLAPSNVFQMLCPTLYFALWLCALSFFSFMASGI